MKVFFKVLRFLSCFFCTPTFCHETLKSLKQLPLKSKESLIILDIDHTLIEPSSYFGSVIWIDELMGFGMDKKEIFRYFNYVQEVVTCLETEQGLNTWVNSLKKNKHQVLFITARSFELAHRTHEQLAQLNIYPSQDKSYCDLGTRSQICHNNIYFTEGGSKGEILLSVLHDYPELKNREIYFVDDQVSNLDNVSAVLKKENFNVKTFHYTSSLNKFIVLRDQREQDSAVQEHLQDLLAQEQGEIYE